MTHTPGPWTLSEHSELPDRQYEIVLPHRDAMESIADVNNAANAHLIVAAPDLLVALQGMLDYCDEYGEQSELARAAIKAATEES